MATFVPEADYDTTDMRRAPIDPRDFLEQPVVAEKTLGKRGPKPKEFCPQGHSYALHGRKKKAGGHACLVCEAARMNRRYHRMKEVGA